jgi:hypothetical protein
MPEPGRWSRLTGRSASLWTWVASPWDGPPRASYQLHRVGYLVRRFSMGIEDASGSTRATPGTSKRRMRFEPRASRSVPRDARRPCCTPLLSPVSSASSPANLSGTGTDSRHPASGYLPAPAGQYSVARFWPFVLIWPFSISAFIAALSDAASVRSAWLICSLRWPGCSRT